MDNTRIGWMTAGCIVVALAGVACGDETPEAVGVGELSDVSMPEFAAAKRSQLSDKHEAGPAAYEAIECENTYVEGTDVPSLPHPSLWLRAEGKLTRVDGLASIGGQTKEVWESRSWSADFRDDGDQLVCDGKKVSKPSANEAYLTYLYPRVLLDGLEWLRPAPRQITGAELAKLEAMNVELWTKAQAQRLVEIHPNHWDGDWDQHWRNAISWAESEGEDDLEYELRRRYQPQAQCGNDTYPSRVYDELRNHCLLNGRVECLARIWGWTKTPLPQAPYTRTSDLPAGVDRVRYQIGLVLDFPGSFRSDITSNVPNFQRREYTQAFRDHAIALAQPDEVDAYTRHQLAVLVYQASFRDAHLEHMNNATDRKLSSLMLTDDVYAQQLRQMATHEWLPSATRERFLRQANRREHLAELAENEDWEALRAEDSPKNKSSYLRLPVGPDVIEFSVRLPDDQ